MDAWQNVEHTATGADGKKFALFNGAWVPVTHTATGADGKKLALFAQQEQPKQEEPGFIDKLGSGLKKSFAGVGNTADTAGTLAWQGLATLAGKTPNPEVFSDLNKRIGDRDKWAGDVNPGLVGNVAGILGTLPMQIAAMPIQGIETAKKFLDQGESLPRSLGAGAIDTAANVVGMALPASMVGGPLVRGLSGGAINAAQDTISRLAVSGLAENKKTKEMFSPSFETALISAIPGAGIGVVMGKGKPKEKTPESDVKGKLDALKQEGKPTDGMKAGELPGVVDKDYLQQRRALDEKIKQAEANAAALEQQKIEASLALRAEKDAARRAELEQIIQRVEEEKKQQAFDIEAEKFAWDNRPSTTGLSTGERGVAEAPPVVPPVAVAKDAFGMPVVPETASPRMDPALALGEGAPGGRVVNRTPVEPSNVMGQQAPTPFDPFGSAGANPRISRFGQGGGVSSDLITLGIPKLISGIKGLIPRVEAPDTLDTPKSPETIAARGQLRAKARAVGEDSYQSITTKEEALANLGKDMSGVTQELAPGVGAAVRKNPSNGALKYVRYLLDTANNASNLYLKKYITGKDSYNETYGKLSAKDKADVFEVRKWLSENQWEYSDAVADKAGLSPAAKVHMEARAKALTELERQWNAMNKEKGLDPIEHRAGYLASIFDRNFQALVGTMYDGRFKMEGFIGAASRAEFNQALKMYEGKHVIKLGKNKDGRTGLRTEGSGKYAVRDDMAFLLNAMAEHDPRYASFKQDLATANSISHKGYLNYDVHEMKKRGITGHLGNKPWLDKTENMKQALEAEIRYFDQASKYVNGQRLLDNTHELIIDIADKQPNTARFLSKYLNHLTGKGMEPSAAFVNQLVDVATKAVGHAGTKVGVRVPENPGAALRGVGTTINAMLMNIWNLPMFGAQSLQLYVAGIPEAIKVQQQYGLRPTQFAESMASSHVWRSLLAADHHVQALGGSIKAPEHMRAAYDWMKAHGMDDFSEVMLSQDILESKAMKTAKNAAFWPTVVPERFTRPTMFMWMVDMFHKAGYETKEAIARAKYATDYTMTDYRPEEAPMVYDRLGILNPETSALQKYKHNALDQVVSRFKESPQHKAAFVSALALSVAMGGLLGLPAMQEIDQLVIQPTTGKSAREHLEDTLGADNTWADGLASAYVNADLASRFAISDVAPNSFGEALLGARLSKVTKMVTAAFEYGAKQNEASLTALGKELTPSGLSQLYGEAFMSDNGVMLNKEGQVASGFDRGEFPSRYAISNLRPLEEKRDSELNYTRGKAYKKMTDKQKDAFNDMRISQNFKDAAGFDRALQKYKDNKGDPTSIQAMLEKEAVNRKLTEKQRRQGTPGNSMKSIERYKAYQD